MGNRWRCSDRAAARHRRHSRQAGKADQTLSCPAAPRAARAERQAMTVLDASKRKVMPKAEFAGPGKSFPVNDANHARLAISGATRSERAGNISAGEASKIKAKARAKLGDNEQRIASKVT